MDLFGNLILGFDAALTWQNLGFCLIGALLGTLIGVLPGIGPIATIAMLLATTEVRTSFAPAVEDRRYVER